MIEVNGDIITKHGFKIGMAMGNTVFLEKEISGVDRAKIAEAMKDRGKIEFSRIGKFVGKTSAQ